MEGNYKNLLASGVAAVAIMAGAETAHAAEEAPEPKDLEYEVQTGDRLVHLSEKFGVSVEEIAEASELDNPDVIQVGQVLTLPINHPRVHVIESGETVSTIAEQYGLGTSLLGAFNELEDIDQIQAGEILFIPIETEKEITIQAGDTVSDIAEREGVTVDQLVERNNLNNPDEIVEGQTLIIPENSSLTQNSQEPVSTTEPSPEQPTPSPQPVGASSTPDAVLPRDEIIDDSDEQPDPEPIPGPDPEPEVTPTTSETQEAEAINGNNEQSEVVLVIEAGDTASGIATVLSEVTEEDDTPQEILEGIVQNNEDFMSMEDLNRIFSGQQITMPNTVSSEELETYAVAVDYLEAVENAQQTQSPELPPQSITVIDRLLNHENVSISPSTNDRVRESLVDAAEDGRTFLYDIENDDINEVPLSLVMASALVDIANRWPIQINSLTTSYDHSSGSHHYQGRAVDLQANEHTADIFKFLYENAELYQIDELIWSGHTDVEGATTLKNGFDHEYRQGTLEAHTGHWHISFKDGAQFVPSEAPTGEIEVNVANINISERADLNSKAQQAAQFFIDQGFTALATSEIVGSMIQESGLNVEAFNPDEEALGLLQYRFERKDGMPGNDFHAHLEFVVMEMQRDPQSRNAGMYDLLRNPDATVEEIRYAMKKHWIRWGHTGDRHVYAEQIYEDMTS